MIINNKCYHKFIMSLDNIQFILINTRSHCGPHAFAIELQLGPQKSSENFYFHDSEARKNLVNISENEKIAYQQQSGLKNAKENIYVPMAETKNGPEK